jgi:hypothetical protein
VAAEDEAAQAVVVPALVAGERPAPAPPPSPAAPSPVPPVEAIVGFAAGAPVAGVAERAGGGGGSDDDLSISCAVYDDSRGRPCGEVVESGTLTCAKHRVRQTRTQISRNDAARRRYGG